jgi:hypothetical protein
MFATGTGFRIVAVFASPLVFAASPSNILGQTHSLEASARSSERCGESDPLRLDRTSANRFLPPAASEESPGVTELCGERAAELPAGAVALSDTPALTLPAVASPAKPDGNSADANQWAILERSKEASTVARARAAVLYILQNQNACSAWFQKSDPNILDTFSSLHLWVERDGPTHIVKELDDRGLWIERGPYIARTSQGTGADTSVAINANGAFFQASTEIVKILWRYGPEQDLNRRQTLHVGPFDGATLEAQIVTLLHELAHIVNAIPRDGMTPSGLNRSQENTELVLERCKRAAKEGSKRILVGGTAKEAVRVAASD